MTKDQNQESIAVQFRVANFHIDDAPYELMLNVSLADDPHKEAFGMIWIITLQSFSNDESGQPVEAERALLKGLFREIIQRTLQLTDIKIVGTTLHRDSYDILFYARESDFKALESHVSDLPKQLEEQEGRFANFSGKPDADWEVFSDFLRVFQYDS